MERAKVVKLCTFKEKGLFRAEERKKVVGSGASDFEHHKWVWTPEKRSKKCTQKHPKTGFGGLGDVILSEAKRRLPKMALRKLCHWRGSRFSSPGQLPAHRIYI